MSRELVLIILAILVSGSVATLISGLYAQDLSLIGVSVTGYGLPLSWLKKVTVVYPGSPTRYSFSVESLLLDMGFWSLIATIMAILVYRRSVLRSLQKAQEQSPSNKRIQHKSHLWTDL